MMASWTTIQTELLDDFSAALSSGGNESPLIYLVEVFKNLLIFNGNPLVRILSSALVFAIVAIVLGVVTNNYSWVDKLWNIVPVYYGWLIVVNSPGSIHPRLLQMALFITFWGIRLTYNFYRKGGYTWTGEDYRWPIIKARMHPVAFHIFNVLFIGLAQNLLLASILGSLYATWRVSYSETGDLAAPLGPLDALAAFLAGSLLALEAMADEQQWSFQMKKQKAARARQTKHGDIARGFLSSGLFRYSRHPAFFAEQAFWWTLCLFTASATGQWFGWWIGGPIALSALFQGSTWLTEHISAGKYPAYAEYKKTTSRLVPWFPGPELVEPVKRSRSTSRGRTATKSSPKASRSRSSSKSKPSTPGSTQKSPKSGRSRSASKTKESGARKSQEKKTSTERKTKEKTSTTTRKRSSSSSRASKETKTPSTVPKRKSQTAVSSSSQPVRRSSRLRKST